MANNKTTDLLTEIGQILAEDDQYPINGTLLYAEVEAGSVGQVIFKDRPNHIMYRKFNPDRLMDALLELWELVEPGKRWAEIEYVIENGQFRATYIYPDMIFPGTYSIARQDGIARKYFGEKPILYPPLLGDASNTIYEF